MDIETLLQSPPPLHIAHAAAHADWRIDNATARLISQQIAPGMQTLETGAGLSTLIFALRGATHTCVVPDAGLVERIRAYAAAQQIALDRVTFVVERSEQALPSMAHASYDLVLLDGRHAFPSPWIDWHYTAPHLRIGGAIIIDDLHIWTCDLLMEFLRGEPEWEIVSESSRAAIARKRAHVSHDREWTQQPYVRARSRATGPRGKIAYIARMLRRGQWSLLRENLLMRLPGRGR